jgi:RNA polymerase sigma-70 factor (ECF subfamily)
MAVIKNPTMGIYESLSDELLMSAVHNGDINAFNQIYSRYSKRLLNYFFRMLGNCREKSQDFLQDIFVKIIEKPEQFDTTRKFSTWIFSVAHNMCKNEYRRLSVRSNIVSENNLAQIPFISEPEIYESVLIANQIFAEIANYAENEKTAFLLYYKEDFSIQEISKVLSIPEGTVKSKLFYLRKRVLKKLQLYDLKK